MGLLLRIIIRVTFKTKGIFIFSRMYRLSCFFRMVGFLPLLCTFCSPPPEPRLLPKQSLDQLARSLEADVEIHPDFQWELFAAEPLIKDPVAMEIDERGRIFVVEMPGYPLDVTGSGKILQLIDTDSDGFPDESRIFADNLILPTGIMRWKEGFLVSDAPDIVYLEDSDGDGQADIRKVVLTGFARSNPQHNVNTPIYGLDNGIYVANEYYITTQQHASLFGDKGNEINFPDKPEGPRLPPNAYDRNVRFRPDTYELEMASSQSQYGHTFDPWGRYFQTSNASHLHHEVIAGKYLQRKPYLRIAEAQQYVPTYGHPIEVFPITKNPEYQLLTDVGTITSACGITWYKGGIFPEKFNQAIFTAEPSHNLIHVDLLESHGASFRSTPLEAEGEFLRSSDPWFRPVSMFQGPDGALYVLDYHRKIVEHPEWMAESVNTSGELYEGSNKGRLYRIRPRGVESLAPFPDLRSFSLKQLIASLDHENSWWRFTAQRLLVDRKDPEIQVALEDFLLGKPSPLGELHALWTLQGLGKMEFSLLKQAIDSPHPGLRENVLRLMELHPDSLEQAMPGLMALANDDDPRVRFQWMCTLGETGESRERLIKSVFENLEDPWMMRAAFTTPDLQEEALFSQAIEEIGTKGDSVHKVFFTYLGATWAMKENPTSMSDVIEESLGLKGAYWQAPFLSGIYEAFSQKKGNFTKAPPWYEELLRAALGSSAELRKESLKFLQLWDQPAGIDLQPYLYQAERVIGDKGQDDQLRADAISLLGLILPERYDETFFAHLASNLPTSMQEAAVEGLGRLEENRGCTYLLQQWNSLSPSIRSQAVNQFMGQVDRAHILLRAIEDSVVDASVLGWPRMVRLMNHDDPSLKAYARKVLAPEENFTEDSMREFEAVVEEGNPQKGAKVYVQQCQVCHMYKGEGLVAFGPDLATLRNREPKSLLRDILYPNRSIADGYEIWSCTLQNGQELSGIMCKETATTFTLRTADGKEEILPRNRVKQLEALSHSGMPTGFGSTLSPSHMADLIAFVKYGKVSDD